MSDQNAAPKIPATMGNKEKAMESGSRSSRNNDRKDGDDPTVASDSGESSTTQSVQGDNKRLEVVDGDDDKVACLSSTATGTGTAGRAATADTVAAAKAHLRNTCDDFTLGAWAVIERGSDISVTPRDRGLRSNHTGGLQEMEEGVSTHDTSNEILEEYGADLDLKFEEFGAPNEAGLARATAVDEFDGGMDPACLPAGLEFDPDAKPVELTRRHERYRTIRFYSVVATALALIVVLGGVIAWQNRSVVPNPLSDREVLGIREYVLEQLLSVEDSDRVVKDPTNPYSRALDWMQNVDAMALTPHNGTKFTQRFLTAYLYFSTSVERPWANGCEPSSSSVNSSSSEVANSIAADNSDSTCQFSFTMFALEEYTITQGGTRWLSPEDECHWGGVTCDSIGNINSLQLGGTNMTGTFPEGIAGFPSLEYLSLSYGALSGPLPAAVGEMKHLTIINLGGNRFTGSIPDSWYQSRSLQSVDLRGNTLTGSISEEIANWKDMRELFLSENALTASIPSAIGEMRTIRFFQLNNNRLNGTIPTSIGEMRRVEYISLAHNLLTGTLPAELARPSLRELYLAYNELHGAIPIKMSMLSICSWLDLSHNKLTGTIESLVNMTALDTVHLDNNQFSGTLSKEFGRLKYMTHFIASGNNFEGTVPRKMCSLVKPRTKPGSEKLLTELQLDCAITPPDTVAEITCPEGCCTQCCQSDGTNCQARMMD